MHLRSYFLITFDLDVEKCIFLEDLINCKIVKKVFLTIYVH